jgi:hypothetical protein
MNSVLHFSGGSPQPNSIRSVSPSVRTKTESSAPSSTSASSKIPT